MSAPSRTTRLWPVLLFAACACAAQAPALAALPLFSDRYDWRYFESMGEISRRSVLWYHQAPLWNPFSCGGEVALANPQSLDAAPTFLLVLLFGTAAGYKLGLLFYTFVAMFGTYQLGRRLHLGAPAATLAGLGYGLSGYLALHFSEGHVTFIGVTLFPLLLYAFDRAIEAAEWIIPTGLLAAWIALLGGTFTPPMAGELLLVWAVMAAIERRTLRPFALLAVAGAIALVAGAVRMLPVLEFIHDHPRPPFMRAPDKSSLWQVFTDLVAWRKFDRVPGRKYWSHEYAGRVPYVLLPLWIGAIVTLAARRLPAVLRRPAGKLLLIALVGLLLTMGNKGPYAPWSLLQRLPVLRDLRVPSRHLVLMVLPLALLAGVGWQALSDRWGQRRPGLLRGLAVVVIALCALDGALYTALSYRPLVTGPNGIGFERGLFNTPIRVPAGPVPFYFINGTWREMRDNFFAGRGSVAGGEVKVGLDCDEEAPLQRADELDAGDVPQERLLDPSAGEVVGADWSPNRRVITVELRRPTTVLVNSNWNEHWKADVGVVTKVQGRLAVDLSALPPGRHRITLRYAPRSFAIGAAISAIALPALLAIFLVARRRRRPG